MNYLTLCFYECPAALPHINMWENLMNSQKRIIKKETDNNNHIIYQVKRDNDIEYLVCSPTTDRQYFYDTFNSNHDIKYLKTLVFGKVEKEQLSSVLETIEFFSKHLV